MKISKFEESKKLKSVEESSELTSFCDSLKRNKTLKERVLNSDTVTETNMRRLSLFCEEIDKFEREFVDPVRMTTSSVSLAAATLDRSRRFRKHHSASPLCFPATSQNRFLTSGNSNAERTRLEEMNKNFSTVRETRMNAINKNYFSSDSVASGCDSGAFSRESTPDLSLSSSLTESAPLDPPPRACHAPSHNDLSAIEGGRGLAFLSSTPRKPLRSQSARMPERLVSAVRRSHTTLAPASLSSIKLPQLDNSLSRLPATVSRAGCSADCRTRVTVNGFCYH